MSSLLTNLYVVPDAIRLLHCDRAELNKNYTAMSGMTRTFDPFIMLWEAFFVMGKW